MAKRSKKTTPQGPIFTWSANFQAFKGAANADPQVIGESLEEIARQHNGRLKPRYVWEAARASPRHPLHKHFEWDVQKAAEFYWDESARRLTRSIMILPNEDEDSNQPPRRAWISVGDDGTKYHRVGEVLVEADLQLSVMKKALAELEGWIDRYASLESICGSAISTARTQLMSRLAASVKS
jgi:hypothetical protein